MKKKCAVVLVPKKIIYMTTAGKKRTHTFSEPTKSLLHGEKNIMHTHVSRKAISSPCKGLKIFWQQQVFHTQKSNGPPLS